MRGDGSDGKCGFQPGRTHVGVTRNMSGFDLREPMRENCTCGSMKGWAFPVGASRSALLPLNILERI